MLHLSKRAKAPPPSLSFLCALRVSVRPHRSKRRRGEEPQISLTKALNLLGGKRPDFLQKITGTGAHGRSGQVATVHRRRDERERRSQRNERGTDSHRPSVAAFHSDFKFASGHLRCAPVPLSALSSFLSLRVSVRKTESAGHALRARVLPWAKDPTTALLPHYHYPSISPSSSFQVRPAADLQLWRFF